MNHSATSDITHWQLGRSRRFPPGGDLQEGRRFGCRDGYIRASRLWILPGRIGRSGARRKACLNPRHLIQADGAFPRTDALVRTQVGLTNITDFGIKLGVWGGDSASILTDAV